MKKGQVFESTNLLKGSRIVVNQIRKFKYFDKEFELINDDPCFFTHKQRGSSSFPDQAEKEIFHFCVNQ